MKASLHNLIASAYDLPMSGPDLILNAPPWHWLQLEAYDVEAVLPPNALPAGITIQELRRRIQEMDQGLLADRLQLRVHREQREMDSYGVRVAEGGLKLQVAMAEADCPAPQPIDPNDAMLACHTFGGGRGRGLHALAATIQEMTQFVQNWMDKPVVDKTGLTELYRFDTSPILPIQLTGKRLGDGVQDGVRYSDLLTVFEVFERMGLALVAEKSLVDVIVIDRVERPAIN